MNLDDEIRDHLERETEENVARGMSAEEARRAAFVKFGNVTRVKEEAREVWRRVWLDQWLQDLRYGLRGMRRNPGSAMVIILTLALGIGMTTAIFSVVNAALLRPVGYPNAQRLVWIGGSDPAVKRDWAYSTDFYQWRAQARSYSAMAAYGYQGATIATAKGAREVTGVFVSGDFWGIAGAHAALGRLFGPEEGGLIVLSWDLFQRQFAADPHAVGSSVLLDGRSVTIAGILPESFRFEFPAWWQATDPHPVEMYAPLPPPAVAAVEVVAALKPGVTARRAQAELDALEKHILEAPSNRPQYPPQPTPRVESLEETLARPVRPALLFLLAAGFFVLLIAAVNIANLQLSRSTVRRKEIAIRAAVGAGRIRVMRQLLVESMVLALAGGAAGLAVARAAIAVMMRLSPYAIPRLTEAGIGGRVLAFTLLVSMAAGVVFGAGPALALWRTNLHEALKAGARASTGPQGMKFRKLLVAGELALAMILLAGAGLMLKSFWRMNARAAGFEPEKVLTMKLRLTGAQYATRPNQERYDRELVRRLEAAPGVEAAGIGNWVLLAGVHGLPNDPSPNQEHVLRITAASMGYLKALGMHLVKGRWLRDDDPGNDMLLNESMERVAFGDANPIGRKLFRGPQDKTVIVGVVSDLKYLQRDAVPPPELYAGLNSPFFRAGGMIAARTAGNPLALAPALRKLISEIDPTQPVYDIQTLEESLADSIAPRRFNLFLLVNFAAAALLLAMIGIYGAIAYSVAQRTREIGVRLALGAERGRVARMVVREGMSVAAAGIVIGLAASVALAPVIAKLLYGVKPDDPWTLTAVALGLAATALAACCRPAFKAAWIDPIVALRDE